MTERTEAPYARTERAQAPYARIAAELRGRIERGELRPGDRVPSTRAITQRWGVAMATASKVLAALGQEGLVRAVPGVGTVVAARPATGQGRRPGAEDDSAQRARIVRAAVALADAEGLAALTMRRLAAELGVSAMSLYRHVSNKEQLVALMADAAFGEQSLPERPPPHWRERLEVSAALQWRLYRSHPWLAGAMNLNRPLLIPNGIRHIDWAVAALDGLGLDPDTRMHAAVTLFGYVRGHAVDLAPESAAEHASGVDAEQWMQAQEARLAALAEGGAFPAFTTARADADLSPESLFRFGLTALLDGLAARITTPPNRPPAHTLRGDAHPGFTGPGPGPGPAGCQEGRV
ncbi:TetR/AcrR family transcriptional regulator C-terminal domain-containing protein [Streptomyces antimicrobicus]|uniref:TetR/AcrR family transcriptional regulator C-terminal domain-containing protein n=1 Tax=Streptomyces antimicrobicus TaxID=2883108 RepID=A0ABS8B089_9ACTN|nr:TetR/AcrR family transcriptional regulator C-terminal domain-containing protein [Streptomyces antimicrobicus]MCB5177985.1 TetR/AcrR family transcriptional regulator C-terminal domain-containing protein [Streptomyces antimicrobicus]